MMHEENYPTKQSNVDEQAAFTNDWEKKYEGYPMKEE